MVRDRAELLGFGDNAMRQIRMKLIGKGEKSLLVRRREITKPTDQAHQQRAVFNRDHIASAGKLRGRARAENVGFPGEIYGFAEVGCAISGVQADFSFIRWRNSHEAKPLPGAMSAPRCIDNQLCLNHSCVGAADTANPAVAINQVSNCQSALKANIWKRCCSL